MQVACSRQQFQPAAVGSCGRQQWAGCGQTLAVRQAASGSSRQALPGRWQRHAAAAGSSSNRQQQVKYIAGARGKLQAGSRQAAVSRQQ